MEVSDASGRILAGLLEMRTGQQLATSRRWRLETSLKSLLRERGIDSVDQLIATLVSGRDPSLADQVVEALLNNETFFFRDRASFDLLLTGGLGRLEQARAQEKRLRIWCAGCSTGQEIYSIAMHFADHAPRWRDWRIELLGTDISGAALDQARGGVYSQFEVQRGLPVLQMIRWFTEQPGQQWQIAPQIRDSVRFQQHSLLESPPRPGMFDIILCRNVLLYFSAEKRREVFDRLAMASAPDACLMLGAGETIIGQTEDFISDPDHRGLYLRRPAAQAVEPQRLSSLR